jgi:2-keto-4-pentenoate hydratase/2-oxohepta-3-ene-1,7-dioic acid hydratase in catechol pathway
MFATLPNQVPEQQPEGNRMRLVSFERDGKVHAGVERAGGFVPLARLGLAGSMRDFLAGGATGIAALKAALGSFSGETIPPSQVRLKAPVPDPRKIICIGLNYKDHARESNAAIPAEPILFSKYPTAIIASGDAIVLPPVSQEVDYEAELVVVIGRGGRFIPKEHGIEHVAGYTCGHDVSARDWQLKKPGGQWMSGKTFDTFAPCGPAIVTTDELSNPHELPIRMRVNGQTLQDSNTRELIFPVEELVAYISQVVTLEPGDLIYTGTPPGVGFARKPPVFLKPGDICEVEIGGIGTLRNPVAQG